MHRFEEMLVSEVGLEKIHAKVFLHITTNGKSTVAKVASDLGITKNDALQAIESLMKLGALIDMPEGAYEAMHPRFTIVNMYKRKCEREGAKFGMNKTVDAALAYRLPIAEQCNLWHQQCLQSLLCLAVSLPKHLHAYATSPNVHRTDGLLFYIYINYTIIGGLMFAFVIL